ncbi:MAG: hypothetical protein Q7R87_00945 [Nanoarchaeota archaeon]|nr:hypothetical protein [Nanoarchaeota archaeon]
MPEIINIDKVYREIIALRKEMHFIKNRMEDMEIIMTPKEEIMLEEALEEHKKGKTKKYEDLRKELGD